MIAIAKSAYWTVIRPNDSAAEIARTMPTARSLSPIVSPSAVARDQARQRPQQPQDEAAIGLVAFGAQHEEDRQRNPVAVLVEPEDP